VRIFLAVRPPEAVLDHLDLALACARRGSAGPDDSVRWSARETWHITTAFYGELPDGLVPELAELLGSVVGSTTPYQLALRGAGVFAHRTLWVGVGGDVERQIAVSGAAAQVGQGLGITDDGRARQRAHLTIGRARAGSGPPGRRGVRSTPGARGGPVGRPRGEEQGVELLVHALAVYAGPAWTIDELTLERSEPGAGRGGGPRYTVLQRFALSA